MNKHEITNQGSLVLKSRQHHTYILESLLPKSLFLSQTHTTPHIFHLSLRRGDGIKISMTNLILKSTDSFIPDTCKFRFLKELDYSDSKWLLVSLNVWNLNLLNSCSIKQKFISS